MNTLITHRNRAALLAAAVVASLCSVATAAFAQTNIVSNVAGGQVTTFRFGVDDIAQRFTTGATTLSLTSATVRLVADKNGSSSAGASLYANAAGSPGALLSSIGSVTTVIAGNNTFTASTPLSLLANTSYWLVLNSATGDPSWSFTSSAATSDFNVVLGDRATRPDGATAWQADTGSAGQFAVLGLQGTAVVVPEAGSLALLLPVLGAVFCVAKSRSGVLSRRRAR